jgi:uncharacterized repeat protein (TIGR02543 family)
MQTARRLLLLVSLLCVFCAATAIASPAQSFTTLYNFCSQYNCADGANPSDSLVQGTDGSFYGTTFYGGPYCYLGCGTVFRITPGGTLTTLHTFGGGDGQGPTGPLVQGNDGNFYGTTSSGGASDDCTFFRLKGCGTVFKISPVYPYKLTTLYSFCSQPNCTDGATPFGLVQGRDGNFYGTTASGEYNEGTVFKITPDGTLTTLTTLCCTFGDEPNGPLIQATDGNFYGTTRTGGSTYGDKCGNGLGCGTVFKITPGGALTTLYSFCTQWNCPDGTLPVAGLVQATDGNFYGTTSGLFGTATVFKITPGGVLTTLHTFNGTDGSGPNTALVQATDGNLYGTAGGGANGEGTIFKISPQYPYTLTTLYSFCAQMDCPDGSDPSGLVQGTDGSFYGTTYGGGPDDDGTAFMMGVGLGPFVETAPTSGEVGAPVIILGTNLTDSTSVTFNGTPATFNVVPPSEITTTVPAGATTGTVQVATPGGVLSSNVVFRVIATLTVSTSGLGTVTSTDGFITCPGTCSYTYPLNTPVALNASAAAGWTFTGWSGACTGTGPCDVTMTHDQSVTATFTQNIYTLTVSTSGNGTVTSTDGFINCPGTCSHSYLSNTQVTLNANPAAGWTLSAWSGSLIFFFYCVLTLI